MSRPYARTHPDFAALVASDPGGSDEIGDEPDPENEDDREFVEDYDDEEIDSDDSDEDVDASDIHGDYDDGVSDLRGSYEIWKVSQNR